MTLRATKPQNLLKLIKTTILGLAIIGGNAATAQDSNAYKDPIYPELNKIMLPLKPVQLAFEADRVFPYLKETQELDRLLVHMSVNESLSVEAVSTAPSSAQNIAQRRADMVRGYMTDNGADLSRITFVIKTAKAHAVQISAVN